MNRTFDRNRRQFLKLGATAAASAAAAGNQGPEGSPPPPGTPPPPVVSAAGFGFNGVSMPPSGLPPSIMNMLLSDPELMRKIQNPKVCVTVCATIQGAAFARCKLVSGGPP